MDIRAVRALIALMLMCAAPAAVAVPAEVKTTDRKPVDKVIDVTSSELIAIRSYYQRRFDKLPGAEDGQERQLWGFTADSTLPVSAARAQLEYSIWVPESNGGEGFADEQNRLVRLRLNDQRRHFDYGANFFSVGDAFVHNPIARARLDAAGLPGPGDGSEVWLAGRVPKVGLEPRFRRLAKTQGDMNLINETLGLAFDHGLGGATRLMYLLESSTATTWFDDSGAAGHGREAAMATLRMQRQGWNVFLRNGVFDEEFAAGRRESGTAWEAGGTWNVLSGLTLNPLFTGQTREIGPRDLRTTTTALTLHTTWIDPLAVNLHLQCNRRHELDGSTFQGTSADLNLRAPLRLWERAPRNLTMTATVGYRGMEGLANPVPEEGMSFRLTVDFNPGL